MTSLVEELQRDALNHEIAVSLLLQKCLVVSTKLKLEEFAEWVRLELDGYGKNKVPNYRELRGTPQVFNHVRREFQPLHFEEIEYTKKFSTMHFNVPVGEIEHSLSDIQNTGSSSIRVSYSPEVERQMMKRIEFNLQPCLYLNSSQYKGLLDAIRKIVLEWSLKLENEGVTGEGMSFSKKEKERAKDITYNISNSFQGDIQDSQIQIDSSNSIQTRSVEFDLEKVIELVKVIHDTIEAFGIDQNSKLDLISEAEKLEAQVNSSRPDHSIIAESLKTVRNVLEAAGGNLVAAGLINQLGSVFGV